MKVIKIGRLRIVIKITYYHFWIPKFSGIWTGEEEELVSKRKWKKMKKKEQKEESQDHE